MIPSLDTYLYKEFEERLRIVLTECYIIDEALKGIDKEALTAFKNTYCSVDGKPPLKEVEMSYSFPQEHLDSCARFVVTLGTSEEEQKSIGGIQGGYDFREGDVVKENVTIVRDGDKLVLDTSQPIASYMNSSSISFSKSDNFIINDGKASFDYNTNEHLEGMEIPITYIALSSDEDVAGIYKGYQSNDSVNIIGISSNMDTARCLDALSRLILITMRDSLDEKTGYMLQTLNFGDMQVVIENGETLVFGRPCTIGYRVTNSVGFDLQNQIREIITKRRMKS